MALVEQERVRVFVKSGPMYFVRSDFFRRPVYEATLLLEVEIRNPGVRYCLEVSVGAEVSFSESINDIPPASDMKKLLNYALMRGRELVIKRASKFNEVVLDYVSEGFQVKGITVDLNDSMDLAFKNILDSGEVNISRKARQILGKNRPEWLNQITVKYAVRFVELCTHKMGVS